jgi:hypothetical protein
MMSALCSIRLCSVFRIGRKPDITFAGGPTTERLGASLLLSQFFNIDKARMTWSTTISVGTPLLLSHLIARAVELFARLASWHIVPARIIGRTTSRLEAEDIPTKLLLVHRSKLVSKSGSTHRLIPCRQAGAGTRKRVPSERYAYSLAIRVSWTALSLV